MIHSEKTGEYALVSIKVAADAACREVKLA
jgi:hypothetical protein